MENVFAVDDHVITCVLDDIPGQITGVLWTPAVETENEYSVNDGIFSGNKQEATLTIFKAKLLSSDPATQTFTCKITIGASRTEIRATQTITIFIPSKFIIGLNIFLFDGECSTTLLTKRSGSSAGLGSCACLL